MDEVLIEFIVDTIELIDAAEDAFLAIEQGDSLLDHYDLIFRTFHNVKGSSGMLGILHLQEFVHTAETRFTGHKGSAELDPDEVSYFLKSLDRIRAITEGLRDGTSEQLAAQPFDETESAEVVSTEEETQSIIEPKIEKVSDMTEETKASESYKEYQAKVDKAVYELNDLVIAMNTDEKVEESTSEFKSVLNRFLLVAMSYGDIDTISRCEELENRVNSLNGRSPSMDEIRDFIDNINSLNNINPQNQEDEDSDDEGTLEYLKTEVADSEEYEGENEPELIEAQQEEEQAEAQPEPKAEPTPASAIQLVKEEPETTLAGQDKNANQGHVKVTVAHLDKLMNLMGEMVLVRNQVLQYSKNMNKDDYEFSNLSQRFDVVTTELQEQVMQTRMQPIGNVLTRYNRIVRDLSSELKKKIELHLSGTDTELDRSLLSLIKDPLTHIVRNSCDHGIETPSERESSGKSPTGHVWIDAYHEGGQVVINIKDDGRGLDPDKLKNKALEKNIYTSEELMKMSKEEVLNLIFHPGFSTAANVTNVSGRGVGMDVVKTNLEKMGGGIKIQSELGKGMKIQLFVPLTLAIVPALTVRNKETNFVIPQVRLVELVRVEKGESKYRVDIVQGSPVLTLRGELLPLVKLDEILNKNFNTNKHDLADYDVLNVIVLEADGTHYGLIVDGIEDTADIVVKPLSNTLSDISIYSGVTVLGDGSIALILDVEGIVSSVNLKKVADEQEGEYNFNEDKNKQDHFDILQFDINSDTKTAIVLAYVDRLEELSRDHVEHSGSHMIVKYRESILRLVCLEDTFNESSERTSLSSLPEKLEVVVIKYRGVQLGLIVNKILDVHSIDASKIESVMEEELFSGRIPTSEGVLSIIELETIIHRAGLNIQDFSQDDDDRTYSILYADDAEFFRNHIEYLLLQDGFEIDLAVDGVDALEKMNKVKKNYDLILTDIDMPNMDGIELTKNIRKSEKYNKTPIIAISSMYNDKIIKEGETAGLSDYIEKSKVPELTSRIMNCLKKAA